jgi:hypothetical protein
MVNERSIDRSNGAMVDSAEMKRVKWRQTLCGSEVSRLSICPYGNQFVAESWMNPMLKS